MTLCVRQADLHQTIATCQALRESNEGLQKNYEIAKAELIHTRAKFNDARAQLIDSTRTKVDSDRATELAVQQWKAQLDQRSRELEELQVLSATPPRPRARQQRDNSATDPDGRSRRRASDALLPTGDTNRAHRTRAYERATRCRPAIPTARATAATTLLRSQTKLAPQDLDLLRIQVQEELEAPHQQKLAEAEANSQAYQQMFFNTRRELERCKAEFEQCVATPRAAPLLFSRAVLDSSPAHPPNADAARNARAGIGGETGLGPWS